MSTMNTLINRPAGRFARHYAEMVLVMFAGMLALGMPTGMALSGLGMDLADEAPAAMLLGMGIAMTAPMVGWMRHRGHGWDASNEMAASMMVPASESWPCSRRDWSWKPAPCSPSSTW